ncbi:uncharacterized protein ARMOST_19948 [Armillaria ostoyae]|uniref:Uncharacterized protein n=1 Tax=Armillaria ostoyae TaxID=47428 RepID=A0A284S5Y0_ARMOS|nr:uncharacterized protein ARMOST_19948 [Armillaria ostoyae]
MTFLLLSNQANLRQENVSSRGSAPGTTTQIYMLITGIGKQWPVFLLQEDPNTNDSDTNARIEVGDRVGVRIRARVRGFFEGTPYPGSTIGHHQNTIEALEIVAPLKVRCHFKVKDRTEVNSLLADHVVFKISRTVLKNSTRTIFDVYF